MLIKEVVRLNFPEAWMLYLKCECAVSRANYRTVSGRGNFALFLGICPRKYSLSVIRSPSVQSLDKRSHLLLAACFVTAIYSADNIGNLVSKSFSVL